MIAGDELDVQERSKYVKIVVAAIMAGAIIFLAQEVMEWLLEVDFENPSENQDIPTAVVDLLGKVIGFARFIGGGLIVIGVIIAVIKLRFTHHSPEAKGLSAKTEHSHLPDIPERTIEDCTTTSTVSERN